MPRCSDTELPGPEPQPDLGENTAGRGAGADLKKSGRQYC